MRGIARHPFRATPGEALPGTFQYWHTKLENGILNEENPLLVCGVASIDGSFQSFTEITHATIRHRGGGENIYKVAILAWPMV